MGVYRTLAVLALIFLVPLGAAAAPAGKVVIAQGVDPTTLDMMNQSETPASNLGRHIFDTLYERDQSLKVVPRSRTRCRSLWDRRPGRPSSAMASSARPGRPSTPQL